MRPLSASLASGLALLAAAASMRADEAAEIARIHVIAIGGAERVAALRSYRATGRVMSGGQPVGLTVLAARPQQLRVELTYPDHKIVQVTDGRSPPWQLDSRQLPMRPVAMTGTLAADFLGTAEFDDPLVGPDVNGYAMDYAGEVQGEEGPLLKLLVTQRLTRTFYLLVDARTYFIVRRIEPPTATRGEMVTRYSDFRPIGDVLAPHRMAVLLDGKLVQEAVLELVESNPVISSAAFAPPKLPN